MGRIAKLIFVDATNHNKFYDMVENDDGTFSAFWGRVDVTKTETKYPIGKWDSQYRSKIKKGYVDVTEYRTEQVKSSGFVDIKDPKIAQIVNDLQSYANTSIRNNYTVSSEAVTQKQIDAAQDILNDLSSLIESGKKTDPVNDKLIELYRVIPRKMKKVQLFLLDFPKISSKENQEAANLRLSEEQDLLDVLRGQVKVSVVQNETKDARTILDAMGLSIENPTEKDFAHIRKLLGENKDRMRGAYVVNNMKTRGRFDKYVGSSSNKTVWQLWHGSRNENWWSIIDSGLVLRPTSAIRTGSMFGAGLYAANRAQKSLGYSSLHGSYWTRGNSSVGFLAVFDVHVGNQYHLSRHESWMCALTYNKLREKGNYDSVYAHGGADLRNDEFIVYKEEQLTIKYLVKLA